MPSLCFSALKRKDNQGAMTILEKCLPQNGNLLEQLLSRYKSTGNTLLMGFQDSQKLI